MYGLHLRRPYTGEELEYEIGKNSEAFADGDPVTRESGYLTVSSAGDRVDGMCVEDKTCAADNVTVAKYKVGFIPANMNDKYEADLSAGSVYASCVGFYANLTGTTGAVQIDQATLSATTGQFRITALDPRGESSTTRVLVSPAELSALAYTQD